MGLHINIQEITNILNARSKDPSALRSGYKIPKIFFNHIHKTGGGSLKGILQQFKHNKEILTFSDNFVSQAHLNDPSFPYYTAPHAEFSNFYKGILANKVSFLDTHQNFHGEIDDSWIKLTFYRTARSRLRSNLNAIFDPMHISKSEDPEKDTQLLMDGRISEFFDRTDKFSIQVKQRSLNTMSRELIRDKFRKETNRGFFPVPIVAKEVEWLENLSTDQFETIISERVQKFDIIGNTLDFTRSLGVLCLRLGLPFQWQVRNIHVRDKRVKERAEKIVSSINQKVLDRLIKYDRISEKHLSVRHKILMEEASKKLSIDIEQADIANVGNKVDKAFKNKFSEHLRKTNVVPHRKCVLTPECAFLGWGLGVRRGNPNSDSQFFRLEPGAKSGIHIHALSNEKTKIHLVGLRGGFIEDGKPLAEIKLNDQDCTFDSLSPITMDGIDLPLVCASYAIPENFISPIDNIQTIKLETRHETRFIRLFALVWITDDIQSGFHSALD